jgi:hypothetical protein
LTHDGGGVQSMGFRMTGIGRSPLSRIEAKGALLGA